MILRSFAIALFVGGCALAAAPQDNGRLDAAVSADAAKGLDSGHPLDASTMGGVDASTPSPDAATGSGSGINGTCAHAICSTGAALHATCSSCTDEICSSDSYCCNTKWDSECVAEVSSVCGDTCP